MQQSSLSIAYSVIQVCLDTKMAHFRSQELIMVNIFSFELSYAYMALFAMVGLLTGMAKTGVHGAGMISVPLLAIAFGGKNSSGLMLPLLIMADFFGVSYYHRHANWHHLRRLFPWAVLGILFGTYVGKSIDDEMFRLIMGSIIFLSLGVMIWMEKGMKEFVPDFWWFSAIMGVLCGFTTMVGNLAGSAAALYLLSMRLPKNHFIGTAAWFFLCVNVFKVPFHVWSWETITLDSFLLDLTVLPFIGLGAIIGIKIIKKMPEKGFRYFIIVMTAVAAVFMII